MHRLPEVNARIADKIEVSSLPDRSASPSNTKQETPSEKESGRGGIKDEMHKKNLRSSKGQTLFANSFCEIVNRNLSARLSNKLLYDVII